MGDAHTYSIGGVHQIMTAIRLMSGELSHLVGEVVHGSCVHIPCRINGVRRSAPMFMTRHHSNLFFIPFAIIAQSEETLRVASIVGERCRKLKFFLRFHQDPSMSPSKQRVKGVSLHLHTTCRSRAEAFKGMVMMESYST